MLGYPFYLRPGATFRFRVNWLANQAPVDLSGCTAQLLFFDAAGATALQLDTTTSAIVLSPGAADLWVDATTTATITDIKSYRLVVDHPNADVTYLLEGPVKFDRPAGYSDSVSVIVDNTTVEVLSAGIQGPPGPAGPTGPAGVAGSTPFPQTTPSAIWSILHNMNKYPAAIVAVDTTMEQIFGGVEYFSVNEVRIHFSFPVAGTAYIS